MNEMKWHHKLDETNRQKCTFAKKKSKKPSEIETETKEQKTKIVTKHWRKCNKQQKRKVYSIQTINLKTERKKEIKPSWKS